MSENNNWTAQLAKSEPNDENEMKIIGKAIITRVKSSTDYEKILLQIKGDWNFLNFLGLKLIGCQLCSSIKFTMQPNKFKVLI